MSELVDDWIKQYDINGDGKIDQDEYLEIMIQFLMKRKGFKFFKDE